MMLMLIVGNHHADRRHCPAQFCTRQLIRWPQRTLDSFTSKAQFDLHSLQGIHHLAYLVVIVNVQSCCRICLLELAEITD